MSSLTGFCGLSHAAKELVRNAQKEPTGKTYFKPAPEELSRYILPDGNVYEEAVQGTNILGFKAANFYLALKDQQGNWVQESLWPAEKVNTPWE